MKTTQHFFLQSKRFVSNCIHRISAISWIWTTQKSFKTRKKCCVVFIGWRIINYKKKVFSYNFWRGLYFLGGDYNFLGGLYIFQLICLFFFWEQNPTKKIIRKTLFSYIFFWEQNPTKKIIRKKYFLIFFWEQNPTKKNYKKNTYFLIFFLGAKPHQKNYRKKVIFL